MASANFQVSEILIVGCITSLVHRYIYIPTPFYLHLVAIIYIRSSSLSFLHLVHFLFVITMYLFLARSSISAFQSLQNGLIN